MILYSRVEVAGSNDAAALERTLGADGQDIAVDTLVVVVAELWKELMNQTQFDRLLALTPGIKKLVILPADNLYNPPAVDAPKNLSTLPYLVDVTIAASTRYNTMTTCNLIRALPSQVRFLQLPAQPALNPEAASQPPPFRLYGLTIGLYPSSIAEWVLSGSSDTLQCLTVERVDDLAYLSTHHPNLRFLRLMHSFSVSSHDFQILQNLERFGAPRVERIRYGHQCTSSFAPILPFLVGAHRAAATLRF